MTLDDDIEQLFLHHMPRLQVCLEQMSGSSFGLEEGSDVWLLLHMLTGNDQQSRQMLIERFEQSGRVLAAEQGSKLGVADDLVSCGHNFPAP